MIKRLVYRIYFDYIGESGESEKTKHPELMQHLRKYGSLEETLENSDVVIIGSHKEHRLAAECEIEKASLSGKPALYMQNEGDRNAHFMSYPDSGITHVHYGKIEQAKCAIDDFFEGLQSQSEKETEQTTKPNIPAPHLRD